MGSIDAPPSKQNSNRSLYSLLLTQLITNDPEGNFRRPPQAVLDQLAQANQHYKIGHLLCRSRNPDFLLVIISNFVNIC